MPHGRLEFLVGQLSILDKRNCWLGHQDASEICVQFGYRWRSVNLSKKSFPKKNFCGDETMPHYLFVFRRWIARTCRIVIGTTAATYPKHKRVARAHEAAPPILINYFFYNITAYFQLFLKPSCKLPPIHPWIDLVIFANFYLKLRRGKPIAVSAHGDQR